MARTGSVVHGVIYSHVIPALAAWAEPGRGLAPSSSLLQSACGQKAREAQGSWSRPTGCSVRRGRPAGALPQAIAGALPDSRPWLPPAQGLTFSSQPHPFPGVCTGPAFHHPPGTRNPTYNIIHPRKSYVQLGRGGRNNRKS